MNIKVKFSSGYTGAVHVRDHRTQSCMAMGDGSDSVAFSLNLWAKQGSPDYCGILVSNVSGSNVSITNPRFFNNINYIKTICLIPHIFFLIIYNEFRKCPFAYIF